MNATTPNAHQEWLGFVQPVGLVVSPVALAHSGVYPNRNIVEVQESLKRIARLVRIGGDDADDDAERVAITDFPSFAREVFGWQDGDVLGAPGGTPLPPDLDVSLPEFEEVLSPTFALRDPEKPERWLILIQVVLVGTDLDKADASGEHKWHAPPQARFERLLREREIPIGLLVNGTSLRLVYAPRGESSGHVTFSVRAMTEIAGRSMLAALHMLLSAERLFVLPRDQRLPALLSNSRKFQNEVSTALAAQVFDALVELLRGFQAANEATQGKLLSVVLRDAPDEVYGGLLSTLLRLVFVLYAEERGLLPTAEVYVENYSVTGLFERLREDAGRYPDLMEQRYGAWAQILTLFRLLYDGAAHGPMHLPARHGRLFDPDAHAFLEGRVRGARRVPGERLSPPRISDGVVWRVLQKLLVLDAERLSYRTLDVEQIGSVYEAMMGYSLQVAQGPSLGLKPDHVVLNLNEVLSLPGMERAKSLKKLAGCDVSGDAVEAMKAACTVDDLAAGLARQTSPRWPQVLPSGAMVLQPTEERRRSGSHYTPRSLTEPIVRTTLTPILERLGARPRPEQILDLKVCDPAMGSGAFLVEACRFLGDALLRAWAVHKAMPKVPPDEDPQLYARRLVAQRCLYGVDKNPFAVDLAKLSLWLVTLAKDHPFTFLDHALRCGDSLVGLTRKQIAAFHWTPEQQLPLAQKLIEERLKAAVELRGRIHACAARDETGSMAELLGQADAALADVRLIGDAVVAAFFGAEKDKARKGLLAQHRIAVEGWLTNAARRDEVNGVVRPLREGDRPVPPFHWEIEFPEVFARENGGFDACVGNPPFSGGTKTSSRLGQSYLGYLVARSPGASGNVDLAIFFLRRASELVGRAKAVGVITTSSILAGDSLRAGLAWIAGQGGEYAQTSGHATRKPFCRLRTAPLGCGIIVIHFSKITPSKTRAHGADSAGELSKCLWTVGGYVQRSDATTTPRQWPGGEANVAFVDTVIMTRMRTPDETKILAPHVLVQNRGVACRGSDVFGAGFVVDSSEVKVWRESNPRSCAIVRPYIGGAEFNNSPELHPDRLIIDFGEKTESEAKTYPLAYDRVKRLVQPARATVAQRDRRELWWLYATRAPEITSYLGQHSRCLAVAQLSKHLAFAFLGQGVVFANTLLLFRIHLLAGFAVVQSSAHSMWANRWGGAMRTDLRYTSTACFETFPFPPAWESSATLESAGRAYYDFRAALMVKNNQGLTATYNRFHDPDETDAEILRLRDSHAAMDRAVLDAYGWTDLQPTCEFLQDFPDADADDESTDSTTTSPGRKPAKNKYRFRWPDDLRDEVLGRLLELNRKRAAAEVVAAPPAPHGATPASRPPKPKGRRRQPPGDGPSLPWPEPGNA
ncbi:MAG: N-6 DNA methylase [Planctomycetes bacterium]|nr:N-6 DNA methylase [Planctomycetota bacterium]